MIESEWVWGDGEGEIQGCLNKNEGEIKSESESKNKDENKSESEVESDSEGQSKSEWVSFWVNNKVRIIYLQINIFCIVHCILSHWL